MVDTHFSQYQEIPGLFDLSTRYINEENYKKKVYLFYQLAYEGLKKIAELVSSTDTYVDDKLPKRHRVMRRKYNDYLQFGEFIIYIV